MMEIYGCMILFVNDKDFVIKMFCTDIFYSICFRYNVCIIFFFKY